MIAFDSCRNREWTAKLKGYLKSVKYRPEKLSYRDRMACLSFAERIYCDISLLSGELLETQTDLVGRRRLAENIQEALEMYSPVRVRIGVCGEYIVTAPVLTQRAVSNSAGECIDNMVKAGLAYAVRKGSELSTFRSGVIIVKNFGHCKDMRMGTMENREVHTLVDTVIRKMGADDHPYYFDTIYVWCESDDPRTEVIITPKDGAANYLSYIRTLYENSGRLGAEKGGDKKRPSDNPRQLKNIIEGLEDAISTVSFGNIEPNSLRKYDAKRLRSAAKYASLLIPSLRVPAPGDEKCYPSQQYTKGVDPDSRDYNNYDLTNTTECRSSDRCISIYTDNPTSLYNKTGKVLIDNLEVCMETEMPWSGEMGKDEKSDLAVEVARYIPNTNDRYCDADNINTGFIGRHAKRVKIIRSCSTKTPFDDEHDARIRLMPPDLISTR